MIGTSDYSASFYTPPVSPMAAQPPVLPPQNAADEAKAAADFTRVLNTYSAQPQAAAPAQSAGSLSEHGHSFLHFLKGVFDVINPLQHIPVVSAIYRHITGDEISPAAHLAGDILYGGPIGGAIALADIAYQNAHGGKDIGETMMAAITGGGGSGGQAPQAPVMVAQNNITWNNDPLLSLTPTPRAGTTGAEPAHSTPTPLPVHEAQEGVPAFSSQTASKVDSTTLLRMQEAPADDARTAVPPELIAARMMTALDKYAAMHRTTAAPSVSGVY